jgi:hypothetical protein
MVGLWAMLAKAQGKEGKEAMTHLPLELCLKLKEAGFPMKTRLDCGCVSIRPTLEELIEAIPSFGCLCLNMDQVGGVGKGGFRVNEWSGKEAEGNTPAEAVARLWLTLNKDDDND